MNPPPSTSQPVRFYFRGRLQSVDVRCATRTVLDWLREEAGACGTKEGCNEGDCGACTVVIGERRTTPDGQPHLALESGNACIRFLPSLHGKALFTVEDLRQISGGRLHPVQQAMVDQHASQCGFCTPGFVMSLWAAYEHHLERGSRPDRQQLADELAGNLCRCTGYRPILAAGEAMFESPPRRLDRAPVLAALETLARKRDASIFQTGHAPAWHAPSTVEQLAGLAEAYPQARLVSGATDIGLWVNKQFRALDDLIHTGDVAELRRIERSDGELVIGAAASLEAAWAALDREVPGLTDVWLRFAGPPIRHAGTLGGNVANGSPIGDGPPVLLALDAQLTLRRGERRRRLPLSDFYLDYMKNALEPGEFLEAIRVPLGGHQPRGRTRVQVFKISKRQDCDISALLGAFALRLDDRGRVSEARLAWGGLAAIAMRARAAEAALLGRIFDGEALRAAQQALSHDFKPISDLRASAAHRLRVARNLLLRFWLENRPAQPLAPRDNRVFVRESP